MNRTEELIRLCQQGDPLAKEQIVQENSGLIWSITKRFAGRGTELEDLFQLGCVGFLKAVQGFDLQYGTQFSTYAVPKISGEIRRFLRDDGAIKVSRGIKEKAYVIKSSAMQLTQELGREPTLTELTEATGLTAEEIAVAENATAFVESIHRESGTDGFTLENILSDTDSEERTLERIALHQAIDCLNEREATVVKLRYFHGLTQERVAKILLVSQVQVSRIEKRAIERLREYLR